MKGDYSHETIRLGRKSFRDHYRRDPSDAELTGYIDTFLELGLAMIK